MALPLRAAEVKSGWMRPTANVAQVELMMRAHGSVLRSVRRFSWGGRLNAGQALDALRRGVVDRHLVGAGIDVLDETQCLELLASQTVGRLAYIARPGVPDIVPVNYLWQRGVILVSSAPGPKLQAAERGDTVAFEVDALDPSARTGWSVVVLGRASLRLPAQAHTGQPEPWAEGPRRHVLQIVPSRVSGRRLPSEADREDRPAS